MKYKYQVVVHAPYYPSSVLFEYYTEALEYYNSISKADYEDAFVTLCEIEQHKGPEVKQTEHSWYLS